MEKQMTLTDAELSEIIRFIEQQCGWLELADLLEDVPPVNHPDPETFIKNWVMETYDPYKLWKLLLECWTEPPTDPYAEISQGLAAKLHHVVGDVRPCLY